MTHSRAEKAESAADVADAGTVPAAEAARSPLALMLARAGGNRATQQLARQLMIARETWWRGVGKGVAPATPGGVIHDFGDGMYLSDSKAVGREYAELRAGPKGTPQLFKAEIDPKNLGRVLDLTKDVRWQTYVKGPAYPGGPTVESLIKAANKNYQSFFDSFLKKFGLKLESFDAVIGPEYVRGGNQLCIRNHAIAAEVRASLSAVKIEPAGGGTGGGGAPPGGGGAKPPATKPPTTPAKPGPAGPTTPAPGKPAPAGGPKGKAPRVGPRGAIALRALRSIGIQLIVMIVLELVLSKLEKERLDEMWASSVEPELDKRLTAQADAFSALAEADPFRPVYADVAIDLVYHITKGGIAGGVISERLEKMSVAGFGATAKARETKEEVLSEDERNSWLTAQTFITRRSRLTYTAEITVGSTREERVRRSAYVYAEKGTGAEAAAKGKPWTQAEREEFARAYVEVTEGWSEKQALHDAAKAYLRRLVRIGDLMVKYGTTTVSTALGSAEIGLSARDNAARTHWRNDADRLNFVEAYVEVTRDRPELKALHDDAVAYRDELRAATGPSFGKFTDDENEAFRKWLQTTR